MISPPGRTVTPSSASFTASFHPQPSSHIITTTSLTSPHHQHLLVHIHGILNHQPLLFRGSGAPKLGSYAIRWWPSHEGRGNKEEGRSNTPPEQRSQLAGEA